MDPAQDRLIQAIIQAVKAAIAAGIPILAVAFASPEFGEALSVVLGNSILGGIAIDLIAGLLAGAMKFVGGPTYQLPPGGVRGADGGRSGQKPGFFAT